MGFWSTNLYGNDVTCDVRDTIINKLTEGIDLQSILKSIMESSDEMESILFYLATADTLWDYGLLTDEIRDRAIYYINNNCLLDYWNTASLQNKWCITLQKLKKKITQRSQGTKKIIKKELLECIPWNKGDIYAYRCHKSQSKKYGLQGKYIVFQIIGFYEIWDNLRPVIFIFNKLFDERPSQDELNEIGYLPLYPLNDTSYGKDFDYKFNRYSKDVWGYYKSDYCKKDFTFLFNKEPAYMVEDYYSAFNYLCIKQFEEFALYYFNI